jgi:hypothetical protein
MSWHHGDWLAFVQAAASIIAILGAFGVVFLQHWLEERRKRHEDRRILTLTRDFIYAAYQAVGGIDEYRSNAGNVETANRRNAQLRDLTQRLEALNAIQISMLPTAEAVRHLVRARNEVSNAIPLIAAPTEPVKMTCGEPYGQRWRPVVGALRDAYESVRDLVAQR